MHKSSNYTSYSEYTAHIQSTVLRELAEPMDEMRPVCTAVPAVQSPECLKHSSIHSIERRDTAACPEVSAVLNLEKLRVLAVYLSTQARTTLSTVFRSTFLYFEYSQYSALTSPKYSVCTKYLNCFFSKIPNFIPRYWEHLCDAATVVRVPVPPNTSHLSTWCSRYSRALSGFSSGYSRKSRVISDFDFLCSRHSWVISYYSFWYSRD